MGRRNFLIEGVSCAGKTSVCRALQSRGYHALNADVDLAYKGDPGTGSPVDCPAFENAQERVDWIHRHQIWPIDKIHTIVADQQHAATFFCGGSRNYDGFIDLFDSVFVLDIDRATLISRLAMRVDEWGSEAEERDLVLRLHATKKSIPKTGIVIDATQPLDHVVDEILCYASLDG